MATEIDENDPIKKQIDRMTREQMASAWRFAAIGDPRFQPPYGEYFKKRFQELGGMSPRLSKDLGW